MKNRTARGARKQALDIGGIVLAGGKSLRLGQDKALEAVGNQSLLKRVISILSLFHWDITIVTNERQYPLQPLNYSKLRIVTDIYPDTGALGGIYTGLAKSNSFYNLVVACDMPFLNYNLLRYMVQLSPGFDLVVPRLGDLVEPLHAVYSKNCLAPAESLIRQRTLNIASLFSQAKVRYVEREEIDRFDPEHLSFFNINTRADLDRARELIQAHLTAPTDELISR